MAMLFAATHPERTSALLLYATSPARCIATRCPGAAPPRSGGRHQRLLRQLGRRPPLGRARAQLDADVSFQEWYARLERLSTPPGNVRRAGRRCGRRRRARVLPSIRVRRLLLHRLDDPSSTPSTRVPPPADRRRQARLAAGERDLLVRGRHRCGDRRGAGVRHRGPPRARARPGAGHVLFTDIVDSTRRAGEPATPLETCSSATTGSCAASCAATRAVR